MLERKIAVEKISLMFLTGPKVDSKQQIKKICYMHFKPKMRTAKPKQKLNIELLILYCTWLEQQAHDSPINSKQPQCV